MHIYSRAEFWSAVSNLPIIVQGALGSALFWLVQRALEFVTPRVLRCFGNTGILNRKRKFQEYVFRRFTRLDGLVNYTQGYLFSIYRGLRGAILGFIFFSVALLFGGMSQLTWAICLVGAIFYFASAASWLIPGGEWEMGGHIENLERIAELETELDGKVSDQVLGWLRAEKEEAVKSAAAAAQGSSKP